jgi:hypothetical protein
MASLLNGKWRPQIRKKVNLKVFTCETKQTIQGFTGFHVGLMKRLLGWFQGKLGVAEGDKEIQGDHKQ